MSIKYLLATILFALSFNVNADNTRMQVVKSLANKTKAVADKTSNATGESNYFDRVFEISNLNPLPDTTQLEAMLSDFLAINTEIEKNEGHQSMVLKYLMSESMLNGVGYNLVNGNEDTIEQSCDVLSRLKPVFPNSDYYTYLLVKQLGYEVNTIPMAVTEDDYTSGELSRDIKRAMRSPEIENRLIAFSQSKNIPSIIDKMNGVKPKEEFQFSWGEYFEKPELIQFLDADFMFSYWAKYTIYCSYQSVLLENKDKTSDEVYAALLSETANEKWLQGKLGLKLHKSIWQSTVNLLSTGTPRKLDRIKSIKADDWVN